MKGSGSAGVGRVETFRALAGAPAPRDADVSFWSGPDAAGLLAGAAARIIDELTELVGPLEVTGYADDARGGPPAEAVLHLRSADGAEGLVVVSRLRPPGGVLELEGDGRTIRRDLARTLRGLRPAPPPAGEGRGRLLHPWECDVPAEAAALAGRKVLVTGAGGFIGARLVEILAAAGAEVTAAVRTPARAARIARLPVRLVQADLFDPQPAAAAAQGQEVVFSLAHDLARSGERNLAAFTALAEGAARAGVRRFVHASSIVAYDDWPKGDLTEASPRDGAGGEYKALKRGIERDLAARAEAGQFTAAILQPTIVYGPFSKLWTDQFGRWLSGGDVVLPDEGRGLCNGVYVDDLAQALILAGAADAPGAEPYIISGPAPFRWRELLEGYAEVLPGRILYETAAAAAAEPVSPSAAGRVVGAVLGLPRRPPFRELIAAVRERVGDDRLEALKAMLERRVGAAQRPGDAEPDLYRAQGVCSIAKAQAELGYRPRFDLTAGLAVTKRYLQWRYGGATDAAEHLWRALRATASPRN